MRWGRSRRHEKRAAALRTAIPRQRSVVEQQTPEAQNLRGGADASLDHKIALSATGQRVLAVDGERMPKAIDQDALNHCGPAIGVTLARYPPSELRVYRLRGDAMHRSPLLDQFPAIAWHHAVVVAAVPDRQRRELRMRRCCLSHAA